VISLRVVTRTLAFCAALAASAAVAARQSETERARELIARGDYQSARELLAPVAARRPGDPEPFYLLGLAAFQLGQLDEALARLERVIVLAPRNALARKLVGRARLARGERAEAERAFSEATRMAPEDAEAWSLLGRLLQEANRFVEAEPPLQRAVILAPADVPSLAALAYTEVGLGEYGKAVELFERAVELNGRVARPAAAPHASFAILLLRLDRVPEAEAQARRALEIDPRDPAALEASRAVRRRLETRSSGASGLPVFPPPRFADAAAAAGLNFRLENSPTPAKHQIETMPGGVAVLDYDGDGFLDVFFANGAESPSLRKTGPRHSNRLYRNNRDGTFTDVTERAGVAGEGYAMGAAAADFDNDGRVDLLVVGVDRNTLYRNNGDGTFADVTRRAGLGSGPATWSIHGLWLDYDADGRLDVLIVSYCAWDPKTEPACTAGADGRRSYCHPSRYAPLPNRLFHNEGNGTFRDVSLVSGIGAHRGKGMGAAAADFDGDGRIDIFVANDTEANFLFRNRGDGTFEEIGRAAGVAYNQFGAAVSSMGADFRDFDNDGRPDLFVTALSNEGFLLFRNLGARFDDVADAARMSLSSLPWSGWSNGIADFNNDGWKDLFSVNGHALDTIEGEQSRAYRQRNTLWLNRGDGTFSDVSSEAGAEFARAAAHRGAAVADFDNDGRLDLVVTALGDRAELFRNVSPDAGHWLLVALAGRTSNRDGIGAVVRVELPGGQQLWNHASPSAGFASSSDPRVHFGLGRATEARRLEVRWPGGKRQLLEHVAADRIVKVEEP
jgi:tetratricopeptide (TPR) repeat protein